MSGGNHAHAHARIAIAGGGFAALEAALAVRALAGDRAKIALISPDPVMLYRPSATVEAFSDVTPHSYDLRAIAADLKARHHAAALEAVAPNRRVVRLSSGVRMEYDELILAIGARSVASVPGAMTFRDQRDLPLYRAMLRELEAGVARRFVFAVPTGSSWPLPLYELALLTAAHAERNAIDTEITLVSTERQPLELFGEEVSDAVSRLLSERDVRFLAGAAPSSVRRDGALVLSDGVVTADRVVTAPQLRAHRIAGVPASWWGFVPTDHLGRVEGLEHVYAAGDMTTYPIKQGGIAAQQADRIAHTIAGSLGSEVKELRPSNVLRAILVGGDRPLVIRTEIDWRGRPASATVERADPGSQPVVTKVFGRYLTPYLEGLPARPDVLPAA